MCRTQEKLKISTIFHIENFPTDKNNEIYLNKFPNCENCHEFKYFIEYIITKNFIPIINTLENMLMEIFDKIK